MNSLEVGVLVLAAAGVLFLALRRGPARTVQERTFEPLPAGTPPVEAPSLLAEQMLERMAEGVLLLDPHLRPTFANRTARSLLGLESETLPPRLPSQEIAENARTASLSAEGVEEELEIYFPRRLTLRVQASPLDGEGSVMVVLLNVTEERKTQRIRREFVAHASHELKSPVASLQTLAEAVTRALPDDLENAERFAHRLVKESDRLAKLVNDLLDLSRLEDPIRLPEEPCDFSEVIGREVTHARASASRAELRLGSDVAKGLVMKGDPQQLSLLVRNLLENAVQYTSAGGSIGVSARRESDSIVLEVTDDGPGIPTEARSRVFERFYRIDKGRSRDRGGTGLGLAIVKHVAELHQGSVELESEVGEGSTFRVTLPSIKETAELPGKTVHKESA